MKTRRRKFGIGLKIASLLTVIAVVSVGLASWIITAPTEESTTTGTIQVDTVDTSKVTLTGEWVNVTEEQGTITVGAKLEDDAPTIYYGAPATSSVQNLWLTNNDGKTENLVAWLKVTATATGTATVSNLTVTFAASKVKQFEDAIGASIGAPDFTVWAQTDESTYAQQGSTLTYNKDATTEGESPVNADYLQIALSGSNTHTYYIKVEFKWGTDFDGKNAYEYFNKLNNGTYTEALATQAKDALEDLHAALKDVSYTMTIAAA